jgi:hypothetical protein
MLATNSNASSLLSLLTTPIEDHLGKTPRERHSIVVRLIYEVICSSFHPLSLGLVSSRKSKSLPDMNLADYM